MPGILIWNIKNTHTIILSTSELTSQVKQLFNSPLWYGRVIYLHGSVMRDTDLERAMFAIPDILPYD
jgi:hypothetical protein